MSPSPLVSLRRAELEKLESKISGYDMTRKQNLIFEVLQVNFFVQGWAHESPMAHRV